MELKSISEIDTAVVAFDFFDTVVHRDCHPEEILYQWSKKLAAELDFAVTPSILFQTRKNVEKVNKERGVEESSYDFLLVGVYNSIKEKLKDMNQDDFIGLAKKIELNQELNHIYIDGEIKEILWKLKNQSKEILLISDFYTDEYLIKEILKKLDILDCFSEIYISSEKSYRKSTGNLYKFVLTDLGVSPKEITMIGDNYQSDYEVPKSLGMKAIYREYIDFHNIVSEHELSKLYNEILFSKGLHAPFNGFLADIIFFISELHRRLTEDGVEVALFCSREGQLLKELFDQYQNTFFQENKRIATKYFYVSRRSTLYPSFDSLEDEKFNIIFRQYKRITLLNFLLNLNFSELEINSICKELNKDFSYELKGNDQFLEKLKSHPTFIERFNKERKDALLFKEYVNNLNDNHDTVYIIDVGWKGTIQDNIQKAIPDKKVVGYYLGLNLNAYFVQNKNNKFGLLFSDYPDKSSFYDIISRNFEYYEDIFVADHGPTLKYKKGIEVVPVLDETEKHTRIFEEVRDYQKQLVEGYVTILGAYKKTQWLPFEQDKLWVIMSLKKECIHVPKLYKFSSSLKDNIAENFGEIVTKHVSKKSLRRLAREKKDFLWVDFIYKPFLGKNFLFIPSIYCSVIYFVKRIGLNMRFKKRYAK